MCECVHTHMIYVPQEPAVGRREDQIPWNWGYTLLWATMWEQDPSALQEELVLLTAE